MTLPSGWAQCEVADIAANDHDAITDGPFGSSLKSDHYTPAGIRVIRLGNIGSRRFISDDEAFVDESRFQELRRHEACAGDLVTAALGEPLGRTAKVPPTYGPAIVKADCFRLRPSARVEKDLILYWLNSPAVLRSFLDRSQGIGRVRINLGTFRNTKLPIPPLAEQRRIVAKLDVLTVRITRARAELKRISTLANKLRKQSLKLAYSGKLTADWRGEVQSIKDEGLLPATWRSLLLGDIADVKSGLTLGKKRSQGDRLIELPYLRVANVQRGTLSLRVVKRVLVTPGEADMLYLQPGDILMNEGGDRDKLGRGCVWNGEIQNCIHQNHVFRVRLKNFDVLPRYISYYTNEFGSEYFFQHGTQTTNLASLSKTKLSALPLPLAPIDEQAEILNRLEAAFARADRLEAEATRAATLLDRLEASLLAKAFRGELVPQDPADEPASVLLDCIRAERAAAPKARRGRYATAADL